MQSIKFNLTDKEHEEFKDLLYTCVYGELPVLNGNIAGLVLKKIEE